MKHLILGTAGHVDHGKTSLVKALTGIDCDTHKEEKQRGITINLGFAHLSIPSGDTISIIDVPGHRNFIHTMVAGASGIDIALLVIAADSGVMPQTREHLQIMEILGIRTGIIAVTRIDCAESDVTDMAIEEILDLTKGTFLENSPVVKVSSKTLEGIPELKEVISQVASQITERPKREVFRMYIDRIFSISGFGTVVTGSVLGGSIKVGSSANLLPGDKELRVRRLERHGNEVSEITAGDRASMNLVGLSREDFQRGMLIADRPLRTTAMLDARLYLFDHGRPINLWSQAVYLMGSFDAQAKIHLLDRDLLRPGENGLVQIHLPTECIAQAGDRFVLRSSSSDISLGGGEIIDAAPLHHRRRPPTLVQGLAKLASGKIAELVAAEIRKHPRGISHVTLADTLNVSPAEVIEITEKSLPFDIVKLRSIDTGYFISSSEYDVVMDRCFAILTGHHKRNPLEPEGKTIEELAGIVGMDSGDGGQELLRLMFEDTTKKGKLKKVNHTWALSNHKVEISVDFEEQIKAVEKFIHSYDMKTPVPAEIEEFAGKKGIDDKMLKQVLRHLVSSKKLYIIEGYYLHSSVVNSCRVKLLQKLATTKDGLTVAQFRDLLDANRKICLLMLAQFDGEGVTERQGDFRVTTDKGREIIKQGLSII